MNGAAVYEPCATPCLFGRVRDRKVKALGIILVSDMTGIDKVEDVVGGVFVAWVCVC
ncbi:Uncharacterised protein [BD1-7 clade bacterium]|uniref:Uncharacterized protein n=1 Tax=BD1-7 clade bacterium TaxID=2029982 RepID=A0A5S9N2V4_9GAMM|nr:Uncharacterised protein [BD1-7 clade bacterium]